LQLHVFLHHCIRSFLCTGALAFLAPCIGAPAVAAQDPASEAIAENIVVTGARMAQPLSDTLPDTTLITREQIREQQATDLAELLARQPGVQFSRLGGAGSQASVFLRGGDSNQVLVLVDGMRINSPLSGAAALGGIDTGSIERIEIVRGNLSSLYGSEAIGGVVQVFTRAGAKDGASALVEAGSGRTRNASVDISGSSGAVLRWTLDAGLREQTVISSENPAEMPGANPGLDGNHNHHGSLNVDWRSGADSLHAFAMGSRNDTSWDDNYDASFTQYQLSSVTATRLEQSSASAVGATATHEARLATLRLDLAQSRDDSVNTSSLPASYDTDTFASRSRRVALAGTVHGDGIEWASGAELLAQDGSILALAADYTTGAYSYPTTSVSRHVGSAWTGATGHEGAAQWQLNLRRDHYSDAGAATTGLAGAGWRVLPAWMVTAQWSSAFRAPSFSDLYYPGFSNPSLRPEHARSAELGARWHDGGASASLIAYRNRTRDLVQLRGIVPMNVARGAVDGWELQADSGAGAMNWGGSLSHTSARNLDTGLALPRRATWSAQLHAHARSGPWSGGVEAGRAGARDDVNFNPYPSVRVSLAPYTLARVTLERDLTTNLRLRLRVENALDQHYELAYGYNTVPRIAILGVEGAL
jgi:vitamin B12 transporter